VLYIGTSGWQYRHWRGTFYPEDLPQREWLDWYCRRFQVVEVNNTFYHLPAPTTFSAWRARTPDDFVLAVKMSRYLTHIKRLLDADEIVGNFMQRAARLGPRLGPVLVQLPPRFEARPDRLREVLRALGRYPDARVAVEFRDDSWYTDEIRELLIEFGAALVLADTPRRRQPMWRTAGWGFVRFHEGRASPRPCYGERALASWVERLASMWEPADDLFVFFNNDTRACALRDAIVFARLAERAGLRPTRVPDPAEVRLGP
jgi:uncharacterized protein YecE (DUF72 family)